MKWENFEVGERNISCAAVEKLARVRFKGANDELELNE